MEAEQPKKRMTDEERLELAAKLDKDLDAFIGSLEKKPYTDGWPEDRWEEEMAKHPFFMTKSPEPGEELSPLMEGLQQLKYDPEENTALELADTYKEDGKFYMQHRKFRMAVLSYTEALRYKVVDAEYKATLYNNRSAANYLLKNYRSALLDAQKAIELKSDYDKARWRATHCADKLDRYELCVELCDSILLREPGNQTAAELRKNCVQRKASKERDARKIAHMEKVKQEKFDNVVAELKKRSVKFEEPQALTDERWLRPKLAPLEDFMVSLEDGELQWPTVFCYPEFLTTDFQQQLSENLTMEEVLMWLFREPLEHDTKHVYNPTSLNVYYENRYLGKVYKVELSKTIKDILNEKPFLVSSGTLTFYIVPRDSQEEASFLQQTRIPLKLNT